MTVTFPYLVLVILFIVGILQPGSVDGILYFITPDFTKLGSSKVRLEKYLVKAILCFSQK